MVIKNIFKKFITLSLAASMGFSLCGFTTEGDNGTTDNLEVIEEIKGAFHPPVTRPCEPWDEEVIVGYEDVIVTKYRCYNCGGEYTFDELQIHISDDGPVNKWIIEHWKSPYIIGYRHEDGNGNEWWVEDKDEDEAYKKQTQKWFLCDDGYYHRRCMDGRKFLANEKLPITQTIHHTEEVVTKGYYDVSFTDLRPGWSVNIGSGDTKITTSIMPREKQADVETEHEYRWLYRKISEKNGDAVSGEWKEIKPWHVSDQFTDTIDFVPTAGDYEIRSGVYEIKVQAKVKGFDNTVKEKSYFITYGDIKGKCQMPNPNGSGYLIGIESFTNNNYSYEMLILDCTLLAQGKDAWTYTTGKCGTNGNCLWTVWQPKYGYYWTLFRVYDENGKLLDQECFGFVNAY